MKKIIVFILFIVISSAQILKCQTQDSLKYGSSQSRWNKRLTQENPWFNIKPNEFLVEVVSELQPGKALDVTMGEGRNSLFLALEGWDVTGYDIADEALDTALARAERLGVNINAIHTSKNEFDHGINKWDLVALIYADIAFGGSITRGGFIDTVANSLKQGGLVVYECMHQDFFNDEAKEKGWGDTIENIVDAFDSHGFEIVSIISIKQESDWSTKPTRTICIAARKK